MFDSNGRFPFLQEENLQDVITLDLCEGIIESIADCEGVLPQELRYLRIPLGNANGPGAESSCKGVSEAKYCHNYYQFYIPPFYRDTLHTQLTPGNINPLLNGPQMEPQTQWNPLLNGLQMEPQTFRSSLDFADVKSKLEKFSPEIDLDASKLVNLHDLLLERNSFLIQALRQLTAIYEDTTVFPNNTKDPNQLVGFLLNWWLTLNIRTGVGIMGFSYPVAYQGMCFPDSCTLEDIETNSLLFGLQFHVEDYLPIISSPVINDGLGKLLNNDSSERVLRGSGEF